MPSRYPDEFRDDIVRVARTRPRGTSLEQVAKDFGVPPLMLRRWLGVTTQDHLGDGADANVDAHDQLDAERRVELLEQELEVLRRLAAYLFDADP